jgi:hypothetical protein
MYERTVYKLFIGKSQGKRQLWRPRHRWEENIKTDLMKIVCKSVNRISWFRMVIDIYVAEQCEVMESHQNINSLMNSYFI